MSLTKQMHVISHLQEHPHGAGVTVARGKTGRNYSSPGFNTREYDSARQYLSEAVVSLLEEENARVRLKERDGQHGRKLVKVQIWFPHEFDGRRRIVWCFIKATLRF